MELINIIIILLLIVIISYAIKYLKNLTKSEHFDTDLTNTQSTSNKQITDQSYFYNELNAFVLNNTDNLVTNLTAETNKMINNFTEAITNNLPLSISTLIANKINEINSLKTSDNKLDTINNTSITNKINSDNNFTDTTTNLPWDYDPKLEKEVCDFNIENRPDKLEDIIVY